MRTRNVIHILALAAVILAAAMRSGTAEAGSLVYVAGAGNEFGTLDLSTGAFNQIGTFSLSSGGQIYGMGFGSNGSLYGLDSSLPANLYQIDTTNANTSLVGAINQSAIDATSDASGVMYAISQDANAVFYTMNPATTGTTTHVVGSTGISSSGMMAVNATGTAIYTGAIDPRTGTTDLYSINPKTGAATLIGDTGFNIINGLFVNGTLYGFDDSTHVIVTINTTTGVATDVTSYTLPNGDSVLASALAPQGTVPEPSSVVMGLTALAAGGLLGLIRRRSAKRIA